MSQSNPVSQLSSYILDALWSLGQCFSCFPSNPSLKINGRSFKILRLLGEGGFSYVYLVQAANDPTLYALKKIRCPFGQESVQQALKEVEAYSLFEGHPNIIHAIEHSVQNERGSGGVSGIGATQGDGNKTVYILLPYFRRGNLQDAINANLVNRARFPEKRLMVLFLGVCRALKAMHQYRIRGAQDEAPGGKASRSKAKRVRIEAETADREAAAEAGQRANQGKRRQRTPEVDADDTDREAEGLLDESGNEILAAQEGVPEGGMRSYVHRDIKPGNIMISDTGTQPILMDLGSLQPSPTPITSRALALQVQDQAAEHSTMPYRAPELFDVKTGTVIDTKVDIWSLGCTLYACLVGKSPFEARSEETGGSLSLCVLGGDWRFPDEGPAEAKRGKQRVQDEQSTRPREDVISDPVKEVVRKCLRVEPAERPDVDQLIEMVEAVIAELPEDGDAALEP
ncbi:Pkinase-domain-containing protein [Polychaeton citri CBS 116435]|uniref:non-specific serine/threonine protein kinase n=1 Tax=Polychaeton citri CBS 116435 TaxID=1314669 RepID=A0A9P4Q849_9PEZI|nr:Pkinase-domain-containing protein [Polychaeton citri CBS 116435]